ncbi:MAG: hypothetical protein VKL20_04950 [Synechocystis sp.]|nr:hypothetical protein [Synechocystis sp.]
MELILMEFFGKPGHRTSDRGEKKCWASGNGSQAAIADGIR